MIKRLLIAMLLIVATASCKPGETRSNHAVCIPAADTEQTDSEGKKQEPLEDIEKYLKDKKIITTLVKSLKDKLLGGGDFGSAASMYEGLATSPEFQSAIGGAFSLFVVLYGVSVAAGLVQVTIGDAAIRISKVAFVSIFAMNWGEFYDTVASFFIDGTQQLMGYFMEAFKGLYFNNDSASSDFMFGTDNTEFIFGDLDIFVSRMFSPHTVALGSALISSGEGNISQAGFLAISFMYIFLAIVTIVQVYVMSIFALALLFALAPIFLIFMLFKQTNQLFDNWLNQIISYCLQPIFVCAFVGMYIGLLAPFMQELLTYKLCYGATEASGNKQGWCFVAPNSNDCVPFAPSSEPPISMQKLILFFVFSWLFGANVRFAVDLAGSISPSFAADMSKQGAIWKQLQDGRGGGAAGSFLSNLTGRDKAL